MDEYISREKAIKELREVYENEYPTASGDFDKYASHDLPNVLRNMEAANVQPAIHAHLTNREWLQNMAMIDLLDHIIKNCDQCVLHLFGQEAENRCENFEEGSINNTCYKCVSAWLNEKN